MHTDNLRGAGLVILAMVLFVVNDAFVKALSGHLAWHQALVLRSGFAILCLAGLSLVSRKPLQPMQIIGLMRDKLVAWRVVIEILGMTAWVLALMHMPLSGVIAVVQLLPVFLMFGGVIAFGERPGPHRLGAAVVSILGVLLVVKPGSEAFTAYALLALLATALMAVRDVIGRVLPRTYKASHLAMLTLGAIALFGAVIGVAIPWPTLTVYIVGCAAGSGVSLALASTCMIQGVRLGEVSFLAPFRYTALVAGLGIAYAAFGERPDVWSLTGAVIIIVAGIYLMHRERRARQAT